MGQQWYWQTWTSQAENIFYMFPVSYRKCLLMYDSLNALVFMICIHEIMGKLQALLHLTAVCWKFPNICFRVFRETTVCRIDCDGISSAWLSCLQNSVGDCAYQFNTRRQQLHHFNSWYTSIDLHPVHLPLWNNCIANEEASEGAHRYRNAHPHPNDPYHLTAGRLH